MILCGKEEPVSSNALLLELDEETKQLRPALSVDRDLNRYSFVCLNDPHAGFSKLSQLIIACSEDLSIDINLCCVWNSSRPSLSQAQSRWRLSRLSKSGWVIHQHKDLFLAVRTRFGNELDIFNPLGFTHLDGVLFIIIGQSPREKAFFTHNMQIVLEYFTSSMKVTLSRSLFEWAKQTNAFFCYGKTSDIGHQGIVVVGPKRLPIRHLYELGLIDEIRDGSMAGSVWTESRFI